MPYSPNADNQRYCGSCKMWYHRGCLGPPVDEEKKGVPVMRGFGGCRESEREDWMIVGNRGMVIEDEGDQAMWFKCGRCTELI